MLNSLFKKDSPFLRAVRNKYLIAFTVFLVWLLIFDHNSLIDRVKYMKTLNGLEDERQFYNKRIEVDSKRLKELKTDKENLEKFAREQYYMKKENEDVFVIVPEN